MEAMTNGEWTGGRLDDLNRRVDAGFERVDADLRAVRVEMNTRFVEMNERFERVDERLEALQRETNARFEAMHRLILQVGGGIIVTMIVGFLGVVVTQL